MGRRESALGSRWSLGRARSSTARTAPLPADLRAGRRADRPARRSIPPARRAAGRSTIDLVHEHVRWFERPLRAEVEVAPRAARRRARPRRRTRRCWTSSRCSTPEEEPLVVTRASRRRARAAVRRPDRAGLASSPARRGSSSRTSSCARAAGGRCSQRSRAARKLGIPAQSASGEPLTPQRSCGAASGSVARGCCRRRRRRLPGRRVLDHGRPRLHRLEPRAAARRARRRGRARRLADPGVRREPREHRRDRGRGDGSNVSDVRDEHSLRSLIRGQDVLFNLAGQTSHVDSLHDPYTDLDINCRAQLSILETCRHENPEREGRLRAARASCTGGRSTCRWTSSTRRARSTRTA